jgi:hypothetical protein
MTKLSLDAEPPSKFEGKKEVKRKSGTLPQLIIFLKSDKSKYKQKNNSRNLEKEVVYDWQKNNLSLDYIKKEENYIEGSLNLTSNTISFSKPNTTFTQSSIESNYRQSEKNIDSTRKDFSVAYEVSPYYSIQKARNEGTEGYSDSKSSEIFFPLYDLDGETKPEN